MDILAQLKAVKQQLVKQDYEPEVKEQLIAAIDQVIKEPTAVNLKALAVVLDLAASAEKNLGAQVILSDESAKPAEKLTALKHMLDVAAHAA